MDQKQIAQIDELAKRLENSGIAEYVKLSQNTRKVLWLNFLSGLSRGLGFAVGSTIVLTIMYKVLSHVISMNIPYITEMLRQFTVIIKGS